MKKVIILVFLTLLLFFGCEIMYDDFLTIIDMNNINVPDDFNFENVQQINVNVYLTDEVGNPLMGYPISIYLDHFRNDSEVFVKGLTGQDGIFSKSLSIATTVDSLAFHCIMGAQTLPINGAIVNCDFGNFSRKNNNRSELIGEWNFNSGSGEIAYDNIGDNNGIIHDATWVDGVNGNALQFDDSYVDLSSANDELSTIIANAGSISLWAKIEEKSGSQYLFHCFDTSGNNEIRIEYKDYPGNQSDQLRFVYKKWSYRFLFFNPWNPFPIQAGDDLWHNLVMTWDDENGQFEVYLDGNKFGNTVNISGANWSPSIDEITIGSKCTTYPGSGGNPSYTFAGKLDELRIYDYALSAVEINDNYNNMNNPDSDGDGVFDEFDDYPEDATKAFNEFYPGVNQYGTIAFEDYWPQKGDYDLNDMVIDYNMLQILNADNDVVEIEGEIILRAVGAGFQNGFYIQLPFAADQILSYGDYNLESDANLAVLEIFHNTFDLLDNGSNTFINTDPDESYTEPYHLNFEIILVSPISSEEFNHLPPYNPFITVNGNRGREVHLAGYPPTSLADLSLFNTEDDNSDFNAGRYYKNANNLPWAVHLPSQWDYPIEKNEISWAYINFAEWAESGGTSMQNWYENISENTNQIYIYE